MYRLLVFALPLLSCALLCRADVTEIRPLPLDTPSASLPESWSGHRQPHLDRIGGSHSIVAEGKDTFLRLVKKNPESTLQIKTLVDLPSGAEKLHLAMLHRVPEISLPQENPERNRFRAGVVFLDADGNRLDSHTPQIAVGDPIPDWTNATQLYDVPSGATRVEIGISQLLCAGVWDIKNLTLHVKTAEGNLP